MSKLSGKALADRARELNITGRSKLSADELREAIALAEGTATTETETVTETPAEEKEVWHTVPNRADKRRARRARHLRGDGKPKQTPGFQPRRVPVNVIHSGH